MHLCCERFPRIRYLLGRWTKLLAGVPIAYCTLQRSAGDASSKSHLSCTPGRFTKQQCRGFRLGPSQKIRLPQSIMNSLPKSRECSKTAPGSKLCAISSEVDGFNRCWCVCIIIWKFIRTTSRQRNLRVCLLCSRVISLASVTLWLFQHRVAVTGVQSSLRNYMAGLLHVKRTVYADVLRS